MVSVLNATHSNRILPQNPQSTGDVLSGSPGSANSTALQSKAVSNTNTAGNTGTDQVQISSKAVQAGNPLHEPTPTQAEKTTPEHTQSTLQSSATTPSVSLRNAQSQGKKSQGNTIDLMA
jgi:hypothetical protein